MAAAGTYIVLLPSSLREKFLEIVNEVRLDEASFLFAETLEELDKQFARSEKVNFLISFSTSVIVPEKYLSVPGITAVNIHAASPEYPGRDPHHYAVYENASTYGATLHYMTRKVDAGDIIDVELFNSTGINSSVELMKMADACAWVLIRKLLLLIKENAVLPRSEYKWALTKRTRKDFQRLCRIETDIDKNELDNRIRSFHVNGFENLYVEIHGKKFFYKS